KKKTQSHLALRINTRNLNHCQIRQSPNRSISSANNTNVRDFALIYSQIYSSFCCVFSNEIHGRSHSARGNWPEREWWSVCTSDASPTSPHWSCGTTNQGTSVDSSVCHYVSSSQILTDMILCWMDVSSVKNVKLLNNCIIYMVIRIRFSNLFQWYFIFVRISQVVRGFG
ncbi:hypothetical protein PMAYCL1PPCAC_13999, partial [Pristionchus mayeri]